MQSFNERMDLVFFFKSCFAEFDLGFNDFRKFLIALGKAQQTILNKEASDPEDNRDDEDDEEFEDEDDEFEEVETKPDDLDLAGIKSDSLKQ
jgi:Ran GTPase-activating protein (RanGAP) involved in mRNA processing and transport